MYADNLALLDDSKEEVVNMVSEWASVFEGQVLKVNTKKTEVMQVGKVEEKLLIDVSGEKQNQKKEFLLCISSKTNNICIPNSTRPSANAVQGQSEGAAECLHKVWEANRCCSAAPTSCQFYKELDTIVGGNPTSTVKAPVDTSLAHVPVESRLSQEEEILDEGGDPEAEDGSEARDECSQELFSTPEDASSHKLSDLGEARTGEEAPEMTLGGQPPLSVAEWLRRIRKQPRRTKEDFLREVMMHSAAEEQDLKEWRDSEKRDQKENAAHQKEAMEQLLNVMERQVDTLQAILALQTKQLCAHPPLQPLSQNSFPCAPHPHPRLPTHCYQPPGSTIYPFHSSSFTVQQCGLPLPTALNTHPSAVWLC
ncbi:uncharacterized protein [Lepidochelys kempii]|uniref:uncharacterized protein n=1 Tax=Lepidochelys kempii TaxID=8472 RepID=UPI003C6FAEA4